MALRPAVPPRDQRRRGLRQPPDGRGVIAAAVLACVALAALGISRVVDAAGTLAAFGNPLLEAGRAVDPPAGSIPWKLQHGQRVNLLLLGYGGSENDAPYLTDTVMVVSIDPAHRRAMEVSLPRDLEVSVDAWTGRPAQPRKLNEAYEIGIDDATWKGKRAEFTGVRDRGGRLAEQTVSAFTGLQFDGYAGMDFAAFRDMVNALGGVRVCLDGPLDDPLYPDAHDGYVRGGVHFRAGCQNVNGQQALELARSRHATEVQEASDFARARRQQLLLNAIRQKAASVDGIAKAPSLLSALAKDVDTSLALSDLSALYDWSRGLPDGAVGRAGLSASDFLGEYYLTSASCGDPSAYTLCALDPTFAVLRRYFANLFVDPAVLAEHAPVQIVNGSRSLDDLGDRVSAGLGPLGFHVLPSVRARPAAASAVYDTSGGRYQRTAAFLAGYFGTTVARGAPPASAPAAPGGAVVVVLGHDYALRWIGQG